MIDHSNHSATVLFDMYMYCIERCINISIIRITRVNDICICYVVISDDISTTFRLMATMVAEFCSLVILIHNTWRGEITISST